MAKYDVTFSCGHTAVVELFGKEKDRDTKIKWYGEYALCPDCYKAAREAELKDRAKENNLPELEGSEKQIKWANRLRDEFFSLLENHYSGIRAKCPEEQLAALDDVNQKYHNYFAGKTSAKWWIESRDKSLKTIMKEARQEIEKGVSQ